MQGFCAGIKLRAPHNYGWCGTVHVSQNTALGLQWQRASSLLIVAGWEVDVCLGYMIDLQ